MSFKSRESLLVLYKNILRSCETYPSRNRAKIYQAIREEWRDNAKLQDDAKINEQVNVAYKGLSQLNQFSEESLTGGKGPSAPWSVTLDQNPMPKPASKSSSNNQIDK